jgi:hypothetical protein
MFPVLDKSIIAFACHCVYMKEHILEPVHDAQ